MKHPLLSRVATKTVLPLRMFDGKRSAPRLHMTIQAVLLTDQGPVVGIGRNHGVAVARAREHRHAHYHGERRHDKYEIDLAKAKCAAHACGRSPGI